MFTVFFRPNRFKQFRRKEPIRYRHIISFYCDIFNSIQGLLCYAPFLANHIMQISRTIPVKTCFQRL